MKLDVGQAEHGAGVAPVAVGAAPTLRNGENAGGAEPAPALRNMRPVSV